MITGLNNIKDGLVLYLDAGNVKSFSEDKSLINVSTWTIGSGSTSGYNRNGSDDENVRKNGTDPFGNNVIIWEAIPDSVSGPDGGWNGTTFNIDRTKMYRFSVWVNRTVQGNGNFYFGTRGYGSVSGVLGKDNGVNYTNPYFWVSSAPTVIGEWTLVVGHIWSEDSSTGTQHEDSGRYTISGGKIGGISRDFIWLPETETSLHRSYLYYSTNTSTRQRWCYPRVDICDGTEPTIEELLNNEPNKMFNLNNKNIKSTLINGVSFDNNNFGSLSFDGTKTESFMDNLNISGLDSFSVNIWFYSNTSSTKSLSRDIGNAYILNYNSGLYAITNDDSTSGYLGFDSGLLSANKWQMITGTWDGVNLKLYVNGIKQNSELSFSGSGILRDITKIQLGYYFNTSQGWTDGKISSYQLYSRALLDSEILQNYNSTRSRYINI